MVRSGASVQPLEAHGSGADSTAQTGGGAPSGKGVNRMLTTGQVLGTLRHLGFHEVRVVSGAAVPPGHTLDCDAVTPEIQEEFNNGDHPLVRTSSAADPTELSAAVADAIATAEALAQHRRGTREAVRTPLLDQDFD